MSVHEEDIPHERFWGKMVGPLVSPGVSRDSVPSGISCRTLTPRRPTVLPILCCCALTKLLVSSRAPGRYSRCVVYKTACNNNGRNDGLSLVPKTFSARRTNRPSGPRTALPSISGSTSSRGVCRNGARCVLVREVGDDSECAKRSRGEQVVDGIR